MDEERTIGPLTPRQFTFAVCGFGFSYLFYRFSPPMISFPLIVLTLYVTFVLLKRSMPPPIDENSINAKRYQFGTSGEYGEWLKKKLAITDLQIAERERKGFVRDPNLDRTRVLLETALRKFTEKE